MLFVTCTMFLLGGSSHGRNFTTENIVVTNRLGVNTKSTKRESCGLRRGMVTLLHVWTMEGSTRDLLSVEDLVICI